MYGVKKGLRGVAWGKSEDSSKEPVRGPMGE